jgi:hypothetical protein
LAASGRRSGFFRVRLHVGAQTGGEVRFSQGAVGDGEHDGQALPIGCEELMAVLEQRDFHDDPCSSLVSIKERVVAGDADGVRGGEIGNVRLAVGFKVLRARQGRLKKSEIPDPAEAAVLRDHKGTRERGSKGAREQGNEGARERKGEIFGKRLVEF